MRIAFYPVGCPIQRRLPRLISKTVYYNEKIQQNIFLPDGSRPIVVVIAVAFAIRSLQTGKRSFHVVQLRNQTVRVHTIEQG